MPVAPSSGLHPQPRFRFKGAELSRLSYDAMFMTINIIFMVGAGLVQVLRHGVDVVHLFFLASHFTLPISHLHALITSYVFFRW